MKHYLKCKKIETATDRAKKSLTEKAIKDGLYENFGQEEVRLIGDKFIDSSSYYEDDNRKRNILNRFDDWCASYSNIYG